MSLYSAAFRHTGVIRNSGILFRRAFSATSSSNESHDDFKPQLKAQPASSDVEGIIKADLDKNTIFLYMKGVPDAPQCGFSNMACRVLDAYGVKFGSRNVLEDSAVRDGIKKFSNWPTIPQIFVNGEFVGGADILMSMHESGELEKLFEPILKVQKPAA